MCCSLGFDLRSKVDFPIDGLDLTKYHPLSRFQPASASSESSSAGVAEAASVSLPVYDLYAVVHHQGAMGDGHYVTVVRNMLSAASSAVSSSAVDSTPASPTSPTPISAGVSTSPQWQHSWTCFNDELVSAVDSDVQVTSASAYVLFYLRRDAAKLSVEEIFPHAFPASDNNTTNINKRKDKDSPSLPGVSVSARVDDVASQQQHQQHTQPSPRTPHRTHHVHAQGEEVEIEVEMEGEAEGGRRGTRRQHNTAAATPPPLPPRPRSPRSAHKQNSSSNDTNNSSSGDCIVQ